MFQIRIEWRKGRCNLKLFFYFFGHIAIYMKIKFVFNELIDKGYFFLEKSINNITIIFL